MVDFEVFRATLVVALRRSDWGQGDQSPVDPVMVFRTPVLRTLYTLSDEVTEFQPEDRLSFRRFLGLGLDDSVPDAATVWLFLEWHVEAKAIHRVSAFFDAAQTDLGYLAMCGVACATAQAGQIIDKASARLRVMLRPPLGCFCSIRRLERFPAILTHPDGAELG